MALIVIDSEFALIDRGRVFRTEVGTTSISALATFKVGIVTGSRQLIVSSRAYVATTPKLIVSLYEAEFTGGTPARVLNRRLSCIDPVPFTCMQSITASLGLVITSATILAPTSAGNAQATFTGDQFAILLKPNTSYVVSLLNGGGGLADIGMSFDSHTDLYLPTHNQQP